MCEIKDSIFLESVLYHVNFISIIRENKYVINIFYADTRFFNAIKYFIFKIGHIEITESQYCTFAILTWWWPERGPKVLGKSVEYEKFICQFQPDIIINIHMVIWKSWNKNM